MAAIRDRIVDFRRVRAGDLVPCERNWRTHPKGQKQAMQGILDELGYSDALLTRTLPDGRLGIVDGHLRQSLDANQEVPVLVLDLTEEEALKLMTVLDPLASMATVDKDALASLLGDVSTGSEALQKLLDDLAKQNGIEQDKEAPDDAEPQMHRSSILQKEWATELGQVWEIEGKRAVHRLLVGDATKPGDIEKLMGDEYADLLLTDPPYNVDYEGGTGMKIGNDNMDAGAFRRFLADSFAAADRRMKPGATFYIWHAESTSLEFRQAVQDSGWKVRQCLIWAKNALVMGRQDYQWRHEPCLTGWKDGAAHQWYSDRCQTTLQTARLPWKLGKNADGSFCVTIEGETYVIQGEGVTVKKVETTIIEVDKPAKSIDHPTTKPTELFSRLILNSTAPTGIVLDPFVGSGTTMIACEAANRIAHIIEIDPGYAAVVLERAKDVGLRANLVEEPKKKTRARARATA